MMTFTTTTTTSMLVVLAILVAAVSVSAHSFFNNLGGGLGPTNTYPSYPPTGTSNYPNQAFPGGNQQHQVPRQTLATCRAQNSAGDKLFLTFREVNQYGHPNGPSPLGLHPFQRNPFQRPGQDEKVKVTGLFVKAGASTGIASQGSLHGTFAMVVTSNGNTAGACVGTGDPYVSRKHRRGGLGQSHFNPLGNIFGGGPFGHLGGNRFGGGNPFFSSFQGYNQPQAAVVSTPLQATAATASVDGTLKLSLSEIYGRSLSVCVAPQCTPKTDLCCTIARDNMSVEEFAQYRAHQEAVLRAKAHLASSNTGTGGNLFTATGGGDDDNLFGGGGDLSGGLGF